MRWPIRLQWFLPTASLLAVSVGMTAVTGAWVAATRADQERESQLERIVGAFLGGRVPYTPEVLDRMKRLSGAEFVVASRGRGTFASSIPSVSAVPDIWWPNDTARDRSTNNAGRRGIASDSDGLQPEALGPKDQEVLVAADPRTVTYEGIDYRLSVLRPPGDAPDVRLFVLIAETSLSQTRWIAAWPPLAIGGGTLVLLLLVSGMIAVRQSQRLRSVGDGLARLAEGNFTPLPSGPPDDEIRDLTLSANALARQLESLQQEVRRTERFRILGQLAGGLAHQLRNAIAGARLAIQLQIRRQGSVGIETLETALRQLELMNRQTQSLLALTRHEHRDPVYVDLAVLLEEVTLLVRPQAEHVHRHLEIRIDRQGAPKVDRDPLQAALLNLITNAFEAAPHEGTVWVVAGPEAERWVVEVQDAGPGVAVTMIDSLFEPFASDKPEGIGIGLAMAKAAAEEHSGRLTYRREDGRSIFRLELPSSATVKQSPTSDETRSAGKS